VRTYAQKKTKSFIFLELNCNENSPFVAVNSAPSFSKNFQFSNKNTLCDSHQFPFSVSLQRAKPTHVKSATNRDYCVSNAEKRLRNSVISELLSTPMKSSSLRIHLPVLAVWALLGSCAFGPESNSPLHKLTAVPIQQVSIDGQRANRYPLQRFNVSTFVHCSLKGL
jgi:hypothetical protein